MDHHALSLRKQAERDRAAAAERDARLLDRRVKDFSRRLADDIRRRPAVSVEDASRESEAGPIPLIPMGPGLAFCLLPLDDLLGRLARHSLPSPQPVVVRGREGYVLNLMVMVPADGGGVLVGTAEAVAAALDEAGDREAHDG